MASSPKKKTLSQRKLSGVASYASCCNKEWEQKCSISPGRTAKEFRCVYAMSAVLPRGRQKLSAIVMMQITSSAKKHSRIQGR